MLKKMNEKKNNKGFSLVELIVVILIMAVLAVALAPQVMKWVGNARLANDKQTVDAIVSAIQLGLAEDGGTKYNVKISMDTTDRDWNIEAVSGTQAPKTDTLNGILGSGWASKKVQASSDVISSLVIEATGSSITVTVGPDNDVFSKVK